MWLIVFLVTGGFLTFFFLAWLALIGHANRLHAQPSPPGPTGGGERPDRPEQPTLPGFDD